LHKSGSRSFLDQVEENRVRQVDGLTAPDPGADVDFYYWDFSPGSFLARELARNRKGTMDALVAEITAFFDNWERHQGAQAESRLPQTLIVLWPRLAQEDQDHEDWQNQVNRDREDRDRILRAGAFVCDVSGRGDGETGQKEVTLSPGNLKERLEALVELPDRAAPFLDGSAEEAGQELGLGQPVEDFSDSGREVLGEIPPPAPVIPPAGTDAEFRALLEIFNR
jgi:hypothetical protein